MWDQIVAAIAITVSLWSLLTMTRGEVNHVRGTGDGS